MIDLNSIEKGQTYKELKECYIIFICTFDPFGKGRSKYTFRTTCDEEKDIGFADGSIKVFYNTKETKCNVSDDTKQLLNHLNSWLAELGRTEDILKATNDKEYQELLFDEFSL